jgi:hypothetical protein
MRRIWLGLAAAAFAAHAVRDDPRIGALFLGDHVAEEQRRSAYGRSL